MKTPEFTLERFPDAMTFLIEKLDALEKRLSQASSDAPATIPKLLTRKQLCQYLQVSHVTVRKWEKRKSIPYTLCGADPRYNLKEVLAALEKLKVN